MKVSLLSLLLLATSAWHLVFAQSPLVLEQGMTLSQSATIVPRSYLFKGATGLDKPVLIITGKDLTLDFKDATLLGSSQLSRPDLFSGLAILIKDGQNIHIKNLKVRGYKVGIMAENVTGLVIENSDFSYQYRPKLKSLRTRENIDDWLSFHQNEKDEWLNYGMAIYLKDCAQPTIRNVVASNGFNGLMLMRVTGGRIYNNRFMFNSGLGIGMYRSSGNQILHNQLDWNVRGYSEGFYQRGQDSAAILIYEQSNENVFAFNSATHSGDGFFLWAGQTTMDSGQGGCNDNLLYQNDFSYAPTNGIEVTFSRNYILQNRIHGCDHGIWGGYSFESIIWGNDFAENRIGIAIEHGQFNTILNNQFRKDKTAIRLWQNEKEPSDWGYAQKRDTRSRQYHIFGNRFFNHETVLKVNRGEALWFYGNQLEGVGQVGRVENVKAGQLKFFQNQVAPNTVWGEGLEAWQADQTLEGQRAAMALPTGLQAPKPLPDGRDTFLPLGHPKGRKYILMTAYGPYNFEYPHIRIDSLDSGAVRFQVLGKTGRWRVQEAKGLKNLSAREGSFPATISATRTAENEAALVLEYRGAAFNTAFGEPIAENQAHRFEVRWVEPSWVWDLKFFAYDEAMHPLKNPEAFRQVWRSTPIRSLKTRDLGYNWWGSPEKDAQIPPDRFATLAETHFEAKGSFNLQVTSDDGVRVWLDDKLILERWDIHVPTTDTIPVLLKGKHRLRVEHFEGGGFACLDVQLLKP